jgi:hypothetical protein
MMKRWFLGFAVVAVTCGVTQVSLADLVNGGFESGNLTGWSSVGTAGLNTSVPNIGVKEGSYSGRITAGLGTGIYTTLTQTLDLNAGDTVDGWYALRTSDRSYHDLAYGKITGSGGTEYLWQEAMPTPVIVGLSWVGYTDWTDWSWVAPASGSYTLQFGVANIGNNSWSSTVYLDGMTVTPAPVPLPSAVVLLGTGLLSVGAFRKKHFAQSIED